MRAIILAAGQGRRMGIDRPKCLIRFGGSAILDRQIALFRKLGVDEITVVAGYKAEKIKSGFCEKIVNTEHGSTNMVYSLFLAEDAFMDDVIVSYGDIIYEKGVLSKIMEAKNDISVAVDTNGVGYFKDRFGKSYRSHLESLSVGKNGNIVDVGRKWAKFDASGYDGQYMGLLKFSRTGWNALSKTYHADGNAYRKAFMTEILNDMIKKEYKVHAVKTRGGWLEFDTPDDCALYKRWVRDGSIRKYINLEGA